MYIPLVLENADHVNAFIHAKLNGTVHLQLHRGREYANYGFGNIQDSTDNAERLALQIMVLDKEVFGHSRFRLLDDSLFATQSGNTNNSTTAPRRFLTIEDNNANTNTYASARSSAHWEEGSITHCTYTEASYHCTHTGSCASGTCDNFPLCVTPGSWNCVTTVQYYFVPDDGDWDGGSGGGSGGGGGAGGGSPEGPQPCNPTPELDNGLPPCPRGGGDGWIPELEPINPCDQVKTLVNDTANASYMQEVKNLATYQNLNLGYEKSVVFINGATPNIKKDSGTTTLPSVQLPDLPSGQKYKTFAHTHSNTTGGTYSIFSFRDLQRISMLAHSGQLESDKFVAFLSTYKGTYYALTITDISKFADFFYFHNNSGQASQGNIGKWINSQQNAWNIQKKYFNDDKSPLITETDTNNNNVLNKFLDFMIEANLGVTLFETDANFDSFTKVEKDQNGTIIRTNCN